MSDDVLRAWITGDAAAVLNQTHPLAAAAAGALPRQQRMHSLRLFSTNDYLGLSTHPAVCRAASDACLAHGSGVAFLASSD